MSTLGDSTDLSIMFKHVRKQRPDLPMYGVGFSLGANLLLRNLGQVKENTPLKSAIAFSAGYCGRSGFLLMKNNAFYSKKLVKKWKDVVFKSEELWKDHPAIDMTQVRKAETLEQLDEALSAKILQYETTEDYYADHGSIDWLEYICIPTLLVNALDDPIIKANLVELAVAKVPLNDVRPTLNFSELERDRRNGTFFDLQKPKH
jgi:predicted alpha/beta-fold hydrolase